MKKKSKSWLSYLISLRFKRAFPFELFCFILTIITIILSILPFALANFGQYQPELDDQRLYQEAKRVAYLSVEDARQIKNGKSVVGYVEYNVDYYFTRISKEDKTNYFMESASLLATDPYVGRLPRRSGEAVLSTSRKESYFQPYQLSNLSNKIGLPNTYEIVGLVYIEDMSNMLFLPDVDYQMTSIYRDFKLNLRSDELSYSNSDVLVFDNGLKIDEVAYSGAIINQVRINYLTENKTVRVVSLEPGETKMLKVNPRIFLQPQHRNYLTVVFDSYQAKREFLDKNELLDVYDRFSPTGGNHMYRTIDMNCDIFFILLAVFIPFEVLALCLFCPKRKFDLLLKTIEVPEKLIKRSDIFLSLIIQLLAFIIGIALFLIYPKFFSSFHSLGYLSSTCLMSMLMAFMGNLGIVFIIRWRSHEV